MDKNNKIKELYKNKSEFYKYFLDENLLTISERLMCQKKWIAIPTPDWLGFREAEWFSNAIHSLNSDIYIEYSFEFNGEVRYTRFENTQKNLSQSVNDEHWRYVIITNDNLDFLYYRNPDREYQIFAGLPDFVYDCVQCSKNVCKQIFLREFAWSYKKEEEIVASEKNDLYKYYLQFWALLARESNF